MRPAAVVLLAVSIISCGGSSAAPSPTPPLNLSGTWSGVIGAGSGGGNALRVVWRASQRANVISGPATVSTSPAVTNLVFDGTLIGILSGSQLSLAYTAPPGSVPGSANCFATGAGSVAVGSGTMSGTLGIVFTSCEGLGLQPPGESQLTLTRE
jgi:hypothetical protein